ncbi:MAG: hypothetical protein IJX05_00255 [Clostridia bacterium]|nr:hypothetical protein [Clostridia bacterium]
MANSVILNSPIILVLLGVAVLLSVFNAVKRPKTFIIALIALVLVVVAITYAIIMKASLQEVIIVLLLFVVLNLFGFKKEEREDFSCVVTDEEPEIATLIGSEKETTSSGKEEAGNGV